MKKPFFILLLLIFAGPGTSFGQQEIFNYLRIDNNKVRTTHSAKYEVIVDRSFKLLGSFSHQPTYAKQFNVSLAAFSDGVNLLMVHAEKHTDGSQGLDYSSLAPASLNGLKFTTRDQCASKDDDAELDSNPEIKFIRHTGYELRTPFFIRQFFATSKSGDAEIVISYGRKVGSCTELSEDFKLSIDLEIARLIKVKK